MSKNIIRSSVKNPCPVCDRTKDSDCSWYPEIQAAISRNELILIVEGESTADDLWKLGIAATTAIGGSGGYGNYGAYQDDLKGARLVLCPDRDLLGIKYMSNFERNFASGISDCRSGVLLQPRL